MQCRCCCCCWCCHWLGMWVMAELKITPSQWQRGVYLMHFAITSWALKWMVLRGPLVYLSPSTQSPSHLLSLSSKSKFSTFTAKCDFCGVLIELWEMAPPLLVAGSSNCDYGIFCRGSWPRGAASCTTTTITNIRKTKIESELATFIFYFGCHHRCSLIVLSRFNCLRVKIVWLNLPWQPSRLDAQPKGPTDYSSPSFVSLISGPHLPLQALQSNHFTIKWKYNIFKTDSKTFQVRLLFVCGSWLTPTDLIAIQNPSGGKIKHECIKNYSKKTQSKKQSKNRLQTLNGFRFSSVCNQSVGHGLWKIG